MFQKSIEVLTGAGQIVRLMVTSESEAAVRAAFGSIHRIDVPVTHRVNVEHGGYGMYSRYDVKQYKYAGGDSEGGIGGYIEAIEIRDPPDGYWPFVLYEWISDRGGMFWEFQDLPALIASFEKTWGFDRDRAKCKGFRRSVRCGFLQPWFYAVGDEHLVGDYACPQHLDDDPVFRLGQRCVVYDDDGRASVKTCLGTARTKERKGEGSSYWFHDRGEPSRRIVHFDDGTIYDERRSTRYPPRPLRTDEEWVDAAQAEFWALLAAKKRSGVVRLQDGHEVRVTLRLNPKAFSKEGKYFAIVRLEGEKKPRQGTVPFNPTTEAPDVQTAIRQRFAAENKAVASIRITQFDGQPIYDGILPKEAVPAD